MMENQEVVDQEYEEVSLHSPPLVMNDTVNMPTSTFGIAETEESSGDKDGFHEVLFPPNSDDDFAIVNNLENVNSDGFCNISNDNSTLDDQRSNEEADRISSNKIDDFFKQPEFQTTAFSISPSSPIEISKLSIPHANNAPPVPPLFGESPVSSPWVAPPMPQHPRSRITPRSLSNLTPPSAASASVLDFDSPVEDHQHHHQQQQQRPGISQLFAEKLSSIPTISTSSSPSQSKQSSPSNHAPPVPPVSARQNLGDLVPSFNNLDSASASIDYLKPPTPLSQTSVGGSYSKNSSPKTPKTPLTMTECDMTEVEEPIVQSEVVLDSLSTVNLSATEGAPVYNHVHAEESHELFGATSKSEQQGNISDLTQFDRNYQPPNDSISSPSKINNVVEDASNVFSSNVVGAGLDHHFSNSSELEGNSNGKENSVDLFGSNDSVGAVQTSSAPFASR